MSLIHLTHTDLDGKGCAILLQRAGLTSPNRTIYLNPEDVRDTLRNIPHDTELIMTDVSVPERDRDVLDRFDNLVFLDHHGTSMWKNGDGSIVDCTKCATMLVNEYLCKKGISSDDNDRFALLVNDHDLWINDTPRSDELNVLTDILGRRFVETLVVDKVDDALSKHKDEIRRAIAFRRRYVESVNCIDFDYNRFRACAVFSDRFTSYVADRFLSEGHDIVFVINTRWNRISLRSNGIVDVAQIAERNCGGGHSDASGMGMTDEMMRSMVDAMVSKIC